MIAPQAKTKADEVYTLFADSGLKDFTPFGETQKAKAAYRKEMNELAKNNPNGLFGLAFLSDYENNWEVALSYFKKAYDIYGLNLAGINYAAYLSRLDYYNESLSIFSKVFQEFPHDEIMLRRIIESLTESLIPEELTSLLDIYKGTNKSNFKALINQQIYLKSELESFNVSIDFYRLVRKIAKNIFYKYFTAETTREFDELYDPDRNFILLENRIHYSSFEYALKDLPYPQQYIKITDVISKMNDEFQNNLIDYMYSEECSFTRSEFRKQSALLKLLFIPVLPNTTELYKDAS